MRIRSIKPEFWKSDAIARLSHRERLTFIALWSYVDDNGVGRDIPQIIAGELFALEPDPRETLANVRDDLARLSDERRIVRYTVEGRPFLSITGWDEHQRIDKPNKARYPQPDHPSAVLTSGYGESRDTLATPSRHPRESSAPGAVEQGSREQGAEEQAPTLLAGNRLLAEHCNALPTSLPRTEKKRLGDEIDKLLAEGITSERIERGLTVMRSKPHMGPALLGAAVREGDAVRGPIMVKDANGIACLPGQEHLPSWERLAPQDPWLMQPKHNPYMEATAEAEAGA